MKATLSLDLDNKWSYMMVHGDAGWDQFPSYFDLVVPRFLQVLSDHQIKITVFVVGQDAVLERNHEQLARIAAEGHEIGNHSFHHRPWLHKRTPQEVDDELARAEEAITAATGAKPNGFRGPGYSRSPQILETLARRGYSYDASPLSTWIGPLARAYYLRSTQLDTSANEERNELFGAFSDGFGPNRRFVAPTPAGDITVLPVTTMPIFRVPIHVSYVLYLRALSPAFAKRYVDLAFALCRLTGTEPSILLHPLDFIGPSDAPELRFFPGMQLSVGAKLETLDYVLNGLKNRFTVLRLGDYVAMTGTGLRSQSAVPIEPALEKKSP
jgi:peptidoglycan-N-acetylglucosamine deacetylase